jgi:hypothetical protein
VSHELSRFSIFGGTHAILISSLRQGEMINNELNENCRPGHRRKNACRGDSTLGGSELNGRQVRLWTHLASCSRLRTRCIRRAPEEDDLTCAESRLLQWRIVRWIHPPLQLALCRRSSPLRVDTPSVEERRPAALRPAKIVYANPLRRPRLGIKVRRKPAPPSPSGLHTEGSRSGTPPSCG